MPPPAVGKTPTSPPPTGATAGDQVRTDTPAVKADPPPPPPTKEELKQPPAPTSTAPKVVFTAAPSLPPLGGKGKLVIPGLALGTGFAVDPKIFQKSDKDIANDRLKEMLKLPPSPDKGGATPIPIPDALKAFGDLPVSGQPGPTVMVFVGGTLGPGLEVVDPKVSVGANIPGLGKGSVGVKVDDAQKPPQPPPEKK